MGQLAWKVWGSTEPVFEEPGLQMHHIVFERGGVCSEHVHLYRHNAFFILRGEMLVRTWDDDLRVTEHYLRSMHKLIVHAGVRHQFEGIKDGVALEMYWSDEAIVSENDIHRFTVGFKR